MPDYRDDLPDLKMEFRSKDLNSTLPYNYRLVIHPASGNFYVMLISHRDNNVHFCSVYHPSSASGKINQLKSWLHQNELPSSGYQKVVLLANSLSFSWLPEALYHENNSTDLLQIVSGRNEKTFVYRPSIGQEVLLWSNQNNDELNNLFPGMEQVHILATIHRLLHSYKNSGDVFMSAIVSDDCVHLGVNDKGKFMVINSFPYKTPEDFVYYILSIYESLHYEPDKLPLVIAGLTDKNATAVKLLNRYISNIKWLSFKDIGIRAETLSVPEHFYLHLALASLCVS